MIRSGAWVALCLLTACGGGTPPKERSPDAIVLPKPVDPDAGGPIAKPPPAPVTCLSPIAPDAITDPNFRPRGVDASTLKAADALADPVEASFARARVFYEARQFPEAGAQLRAIAFDHPDSKVGIYATELYLDSLNTLGSRGGRAICFREMATDVGALHELYCTARRKANAHECEMLDSLRIETENAVAQRTYMDAQSTNDTHGYIEAGTAFLTMVQTWCLPTPKYARCDELIHNAAVAFMAGGDKASAEKARAILLDPKNKLKAAPELVKKLDCLIAGTASAACK